MIDGQAIRIRRKGERTDQYFVGNFFHKFEKDGKGYIVFLFSRDVLGKKIVSLSCAAEEDCTPIEEPKPRILYECDRRACGRCSYPNCQHTNDISHAKNFHVCGEKIFVEGEIGE